MYDEFSHEIDMLLDSCWKICSENPVGRAIQTIEETMCQRNCYQKYNVYKTAATIKGSAAEFYEKKYLKSLKKDKDVGKLLKDPWNKAEKEAAYEYIENKRSNAQ